MTECWAPQNGKSDKPVGLHLFVSLATFRCQKYQQALELNYLAFCFETVFFAVFLRAGD